MGAGDAGEGVEEMPLKCHGQPQAFYAAMWNELKIIIEGMVDGPGSYAGKFYTVMGDKRFAMSDFIPQTVVGTGSNIMA